jgi:hypothetical protein
MLGLHSSMVIIDEVHRMNDDDNHVPNDARLADLTRLSVAEYNAQAMQNIRANRLIDPDAFAAAVNQAPNPGRYARSGIVPPRRTDTGTRDFTHTVERAGATIQWVLPNPDVAVWRPEDTAVPEAPAYRQGSWTAPSAGTWRITVNTDTNEVIGTMRMDIPNIPPTPYNQGRITAEMLGQPVRIDENVPPNRIFFENLDRAPVQFERGGEPDPFERNPVAPFEDDLKVKPPLCACGDPTNKGWEHTQDACDFLD